MVASHHILVVDDDQEIRRLLSRYLTEQGFRVTPAGDAREFHKRLEGDRYDLVVLDVMLPDGSGLDLCRLLRQRHPGLPVILVTALREEVDRIIGLELGADDYIGKPFNPRELLARIRAVLRRAGHGKPAPVRGARRYRFGTFAVDMAARTVTSEIGEELDLTGAEFDLLRVFLERPGRILSREQLLDHTQGREAGPYDRSIDVLMSRIRRKLSAHSDATIFKTVRNGGYQLTVPVAEEDDA
jgi:two-component system, OmpR family, response regulator